MHSAIGFAASCMYSQWTSRRVKHVRSYAALHKLKSSAVRFHCRSSVCCRHESFVELFFLLLSVIQITDTSRCAVYLYTSHPILIRRWHVTPQTWMLTKKAYRQQLKLHVLLLLIAVSNYTHSVSISYSLASCVNRYSTATLRSLKSVWVSIEVEVVLQMKR
jgi:hypothetical protein